MHSFIKRELSMTPHATATNINAILLSWQRRHLPTYLLSRIRAPFGVDVSHLDVVVHSVEMCGGGSTIVIIVPVNGPLRRRPQAVIHIFRGVVAEEVDRGRATGGSRRPARHWGV